MAIDAGLLAGPADLTTHQAPQMDFVGSQQKMYSLADSELQYKHQQEGENDKKIIQEYLKSGGNFGTPEGTKRATEELKGKVSPKMYEHLLDFHNTTGKREREIQDYYLQLPPEVMKAQQANEDVLMQAAQSAYGAYEKEFPTIGAPAAKEHMKAAIQANLGRLATLKNEQGQPLIPEDQLSKLVELEPGELKAYIDHSHYGRGLAEQALKQRKLEAEAKVKEHQAEKPQGTAGELEALNESLANGDITQAEYEIGMAHLRNPRGAGAAGASSKPQDVLLDGERTKVIYNPQTSQYTDLNGNVIQDPVNRIKPAPRADQPRIGEERAAMQYNTLKLAIKELDDLAAGGQSDMPFAGDIHFDQLGIPSAVGRFGVKRELTDKEQQMVTAAQLFAEAAGHLERGAKLTNDQFLRVVGEFVPQPGDKPGTKKLKRDHRQNILEGAKITSGSVGEKLDKSRAERDANTPREIETEDLGGAKMQSDMSPEATQAAIQDRRKTLNQTLTDPNKPESAKKLARLQMDKLNEEHPQQQKKLPTKNQQGWVLHVDKDGNKAYVGPKGEIQEVK